MKRLWPLLLFLATPLVALDPEKGIHQYLFRTWSQKEGLPQNSVHTLLHTKRGYLWMGTQEGLVCFDGVRFTVFDAHSLFGLKNLYIQYLYEDDSGIWMATDRGVHLLTTAGLVDSEPTRVIGDRDVRVVYKDRQGVLWFGVYEASGLYRYDGNEVVRFGNEQGLDGDWVITLHEDESGRLMAGSNKGLFILEGERFQRVEGLDRRVWIMTSDRMGRHWIGTHQGLFYYKDGEVTAFDQVDAADWRVSALHEDRDGNLWVGVEDTGVMRLRGGRYVDRFTDFDLTIPWITQIVEDSEGTIWVGTNGGGLSAFSNVAATTYSTREGLSHKMVSGLSTGSNGALWIATFGGGLSSYQNGEFTQFGTDNGLPDNRIHTVIEDRQGHIWAATESNGLARIRNGEVTIIDEAMGLPGRRPTSLFEDTDGSIWAPCEQGLARINGDEITTYTMSYGLKSNYVSNLYRDSTGVLWVASFNGLMIFDGSCFVESPVEGLNNVEVFGMREDSENRLWLSTFGKGLWVYDGEQAHAFGAEKGLPTTNIHDIYPDEVGNLWLSTNIGIYSVSIRGLLASPDQDLLNLSAYGFGEGMKSRECNGGSYPSITATPDGRIWFPTTDGVVAVSPADPRGNLQAPPVYIERVHVNGQQVPVSNRIALPSGATHLEIRYTGISFLSPEQVRFQVQLEGYDKKPGPGTDNRVAYYTNLPPGNYSFRVRAANRDGVWSQEAASIRIRQKAQFYQTDWFRWVLLALFVLLALAVHRWQHRRMQRHERHLKQMVRNKSSDLENANARLLSTQGEVVAAAHRAGMIEIATNVLHLIGDAIHKVKRDAALIEGSIRKTNPYLDLHQLVDDAQKSHPNWKTYLAETGHKDRFVDHVLALPHHAEQLRIQVRHIQNHLNHMIRTVRAQQDYARIRSSVALVDVNETIEDAIRLRSRLINDLEVELERQFESLPSFKGQKSKLLRTLVAIIQNACESMAPQPDGLRKLVIHTHRQEDQIMIDLRDTGQGIDSSDLQKIFTHGFTTKPGHQGFGLHTAAGVMAEMGGQIMVDSQGSGKGCIFRLELPIVSVEARDTPIESQK